MKRTRPVSERVGTAKEKSFSRGKEAKKFPPKKSGLKGDDGKRSRKSPLTSRGK